MKIAKYLILFLIVLTCGASARAVDAPCTYRYVTNLAVYETQDLTADQSSFVTSVAMEGTFSVVIGPFDPNYCSQFDYDAMVARINAATYRPEILHSIGSPGFFDPVPPNTCFSSYVRVQTDKTTPQTVGVAYPFYFGALLRSTLDGAVWSSSLNKYIEAARTKLATTGVWSNCRTGIDGTTLCDVSVQLFCTPATTPPDMVVSLVRAQTYPPIGPPFYGPFWWAIGVGVRFTPTLSWYFNNLTTYAVALSSPQDLGTCTKTQ